MTDKKIELFKKIPIKTFADPKFLAFIETIWKTNYQTPELQHFKNTLYIFWIQPEPPILNQDLSIYLEIGNETLIPHLIYGKIPIINRSNTVMIIFSPSTLVREDITVFANFTGLKLFNYAQRTIEIMRFMGHCYNKMNEGFGYPYDAKKIVKIYDQSKFFENPPVKENNSINGKYEIPNYLADMGYNKIYYSPKESINKSENKMNFKNFPEKNFVSILFKGILVDKPELKDNELVIMALEKDKINIKGGIDKIDTDIHSQFLNTFRDIILEEPEFYKDITTYEAFRPVVILSDFFTASFQRFPKNKKSLDENIDFLLVNGIIDPYLKPPCLTKKGLIYRKILFLGGITNMYFLQRLPISNKPDDFQKLKDFTNFKIPSKYDFITPSE